MKPALSAIDIKDSCPYCGGSLFAYWHTPATDHPELGQWYVECTSHDCSYHAEDGFIDLEALAKKYSIDINGCRKCGGPGKPGTALDNPMVEGSEGHGTISQGLSTALIPCMKCENCGHSWVPAEKKKP